jgi:regulator of replication initiation timing
LTTERDNMTNQLGVAFQTCEELKNEKLALLDENDALRQEVDALRGDNDELRDQLNHEMSQHREETVNLRQQFDQAANATEKENATLNAELARIRAQNDEHTQQFARQDAELRKARQEKAEYARLQADHETLKAQLASMKAKREEEMKRWTQQESALKAQVDRRDETIRHFQDATQEQTNEAMRLDNENLRQELAQLAAQHDDDYERWARKETQLKRKVQQREAAARQTLDITREVLNNREANEQETLQRKPSYRREDTGSRIKSRVQQESRNSRAELAQSSRSQENPRREYTGASRQDFSRSLPAQPRRSFSAPAADKNAYAETPESTTDLSLKPHGTPYMSRSLQSTRPPVTIHRPADLDLTELSFIGSDVIAQLRRQLEEQRANARRASTAPVEHAVRDDTVRSQRQTREDTIRSVASAKSERRPSLVRKSSLKDTTRRTTASQFEDDVTGNVSNLDADTEATQTKPLDLSMHSNMSRRRRSAPDNMTSAFIVPDLKIESRRPSITATTISKHDKHHDNANCTVCRREGLTTSKSDLRVPRLVPVSNREPDEIDATLRPARSPKEALALVVKELQDERAHLHIELAALRVMLENHDASQGARKRADINANIQDTLRRLEIKDAQIYNLYDVLEGQAADGDITEQDVEDITDMIRAQDEQHDVRERVEPVQKSAEGDADMSHVEFSRGKKGQGKRVTIRSFVSEDFTTEDEFGKDADRKTMLDDETEELPWEGFEDSEIPEGWGRVH